jgi:hypothetical protein
MRFFCFFFLLIFYYSFIHMCINWVISPPCQPPLSAPPHFLTSRHNLFCPYPLFYWREDISIIRKTKWFY